MNARARQSLEVPRPKRPRPIEEMRSYQFPAWVMVAWVAWLLLVSPLVVGLAVWVGVPTAPVVIGWVVATIVLYVRTWGRHASRTNRGRHSDEDDEGV